MAIIWSTEGSPMATRLIEADVLMDAGLPLNEFHSPAKVPVLRDPDEWDHHETDYRIEQLEEADRWRELEERSRRWL